MMTAFFAFGQIIGPLVSSFIVESNSLVAGTASTAFVLGIGAACAWGYGRVQRQTQKSMHLLDL